MDELKRKVLTLTGIFETGALPPQCWGVCAGNFDGMGISFGVLQWNLGQGTLQPLWKNMLKHRPESEEALSDYLPDIEKMLTRPVKDQLKWADAHTLRENNRRLLPGLKTALSYWGRLLPEEQIEAAEPYFQKAAHLCEEYELTSERAYAVMFDIAVQNGGIPAKLKPAIMEQYRDWKSGRTFEQEIVSLESPFYDESLLLDAIIRKRSEICKPQWIQDVQARKYTILTGEGRVHGRAINLRSKRLGLELSFEKSWRAGHGGQAQETTGT